MPRKLKPYKVETVNHSKHGLKVDLYLDRNDQQFFATLHGEEYRADSAAETKKLLWDAMEAWRPLEWEQVLLVNWEDRSYEATWNDSLAFGCALEFSFDRAEVSKTASGREIARPFLPRGAAFGEEEPSTWEVKSRKENDDWEHTRHTNKYTRLPYDEKIWQTLVELKKRTDILITALSEILQKPERLKTLAASVLEQLPASSNDAG